MVKYYLAQVGIEVRALSPPQNTIMRTIAFIFCLFFIFCGYLFIDEILWNLDSNKDTRYVIEVVQSDGEKKVYITYLPHDTHFQVNHHRSYGKYDYYSLEYLPSGFWGGHWSTFRKDVKDFRIIKKNNINPKK